MTGPERIGRYLLLADLDPEQLDPAVQFFRGHDEVLDREVSLRILDADDPRAPAFLGAARAAAARLSSSRRHAAKQGP